MINYYLLTKPGIILGNLLTVTAGFFLASKGKLSFSILFATLVGLALIIASACVCNNYIDRFTDRRMKRTKNRALAKGLISGGRALLFAGILSAMGFFSLAFYTNLLTTLLAALAFFIYVFVYSFLKSRTTYATAIGSVAGAAPPVIGYCAVSNQFDLGACLLFMMMVMWQMPHFFSIALFNLDDYTAANIPLLPIKKGIFRTKIHMALYIIGFVLTLFLLTFLNFTGIVFLILTASLGLIWLLSSFRGFLSDNDSLWGKQMFRLSLVVITAVCFILPLDISYA